MTEETNHQIDGETSFPIYKFDFRWIEDGIQDPKYPNWYEGLSEGRIYNSTGFSKMFKEDKTQGWLDEYAINWWNEYLKKNDSIKNPQLLKIEAKFYEYETWILTWFQHETFDMGQTDEEAIKSFENFVDRKVSLIRNQGEDAYCLMGAEDRYRWSGSEPSGESDDRSDPPCRCKFCKEQGLLRIGH